MYSSLCENDLDSFFLLMEERTELFQQLTALGQPKDGLDEWRQMGDALKKQQQRIADQLAVQDQRLSAAMGDLVRYRKAHNRYNPRPARRTILNKNLRG